MNISCRHQPRRTILEMTGRCVVSPEETEILPLRSTIARLIAEGRVRIAANLKGLASVDARGLGELVLTHRLLRAAGGGLTLIAPNARVRRMLAVTRLDTFLPVYDVEPESEGPPRAAIYQAGSSARCR